MIRFLFGVRSEVMATKVPPARGPSLLGKSRLLALLLFPILASPLPAYDVPLTEASIRDAYFLGRREDGLKPTFLRKYERSIPTLKQGTYTSQVRIETPFLQVAEHSREDPNYSAQSAVRDFLDKPMSFRARLDVCYTVQARENAVKVRITQNKKEVVPKSVESSPYSEPTESGSLPPNGERIVLEVMPAKIDSSDLIFLIDTRDGQHAEVVFDLQSIR